jgi:hypothetical protein
VAFAKILKNHSGKQSANLQVSSHRETMGHDELMEGTWAKDPVEMEILIENKTNSPIE